MAANAQPDREEALRDDFQFDSGTYGYDDSEDEWHDEEASWEGAENEEEAPTEVKDESTAYLEFLNEEVSLQRDKSRRHFFPRRLAFADGLISGLT